MCDEEHVYFMWLMIVSFCQSALLYVSYNFTYIFIIQSVHFFK